MPITRKSLLCLALLAPATLYAAAESPLSPGKIYQYGKNISGESLAVGNGGILYVAGDVIDAVDGQISHGASDVFVSAFSTQGQKLWTRVIGSEGSDYTAASATDSQGNLYVAGATASAFAGREAAGSFDAFVTKIAADGSIRWKVQFGSEQYDKAEALTIDKSGNLYIAGRTAGELEGNPTQGGYDAYLAKLDPTGKTVWIKQFGTEDYDSATALTATGDQIVVGGYSWGSLDGKYHYKKPSIVIRSYTSQGDVQWTRQFGTARPDRLTVLTAAPNGDILATGYSYGNLDEQPNQGDADVFVSRLTANGEKLWTRLLGSDKSDTAKAMTIDREGRILVTGYTYGNLDNGTGHGRYDAFTAAWSGDGTLLDVVQFGGRGFNQANSIAVAPGNNVFVLGNAASDIDGDPETGNGRVFLARLGTASVATTTDTYPPNLILKRQPGGFRGFAGDSEDINLSGMLESREDLNSNGVIDYRSEDRNGDGLLATEEDSDLDGILNQDSGLAEISLSNAVNLRLDVPAFESGSQRAGFELTRIDPDLPAAGQLIIRDVAGNLTRRDIKLTHEICATAIDENHQQDSGEIHIPQWSASPLDAANNRPDYTLWITGVDHPELFSRLPTVSYPSWSLDYAIKPDAVGTARVSYEVVDYATGGKQYYCGQDSFRISVLPLINEPAPSEPEAPAIVAISGIELPIDLIAGKTFTVDRITAIGQPPHGSIKTTGNIATYLSNPGYIGGDRFSYWVRDDNGAEKAFQIRLDVKANTGGETSAVPKTPVVVKGDAATNRYPITARGGGTLNWLLLIPLLGLRKRRTARQR